MFKLVCYKFESARIKSRDTFIAIVDENGIVVNINFYFDLSMNSSIKHDRNTLVSGIETLEDAYSMRDIELSKINADLLMNVTPTINENNVGRALSKKYSYVYVMTNILNGLKYVGSHTTDDLNDGYYGSGRRFNEIYNSVGSDFFQKELICLAEDFNWAKSIEGDTIKRYRNEDIELYNLTSAGFGGNYGDEVNAKISESHKKNWEENYDELKAKIHTIESAIKRSESLKNYFKDNESARAERSARMIKINQDPEKIAKTAEKHRGMKRSDDTKKSISDARLSFLENASQEDRDNATGKNMIYVTDTLTWRIRREAEGYVVGDNEVIGMLKDPKKPFKKRSMVTDLGSMVERWEEAGYVMKDNEFKGNVKRARAFVKSR